MLLNVLFCPNQKLLYLLQYYVRQRKATDSHIIEPGTNKCLSFMLKMALTIIMNMFQFWCDRPLR